MIRCVIIEDQPPAQRILQKYVGDMGNLELKGTFSDGIQALDFIKSNPVDLLFLDIHLPKLSGIDFLNILDNKPHVILTTAFSDYALESYEYNVVDYLLKPFSFERFVKAVSKIPVRKERDPTGTTSGESVGMREEIFVKSGYEHLKINIADIVYIKSDADYTELVTADKKYLSSEPLRYWMENLDPKRFVRSHKSFVINTAKIEKVMGNQIYMTDQIKAPIGRAYKESFMKHLLR